MLNEKNELSLLNFPPELIFLIASFLDPTSVLNFRLVNKAWEQISRYLFINAVPMEISCGTFSVFLLCGNSQLWGWGANPSNELAMPSYSYPSDIVCYKPQKASLKNVAKIAMGPGSSFAITKNGEVYSSGNNLHGQLGIGNREKYTLPQLIPNFRATQIVAGDGFVLAIGEDKQLYSWGYNNQGQLGLGHEKSCFTPQVIPNIENADKIAAGDYFSVALTKEGKLYIWGNLDPRYKNRHSTPQLLATSKDITDVYAGENFIVTLKNNGKASTWGRNSEGEIESIEIPGIENIVKISVCSDSCLALSKDGSVYFWNKADVMPQKKNGLNNIIEIGQGSKFSVVLDKDGVVYTWGGNNLGSLGIGKSYKECNIPQIVQLSEEPIRIRLIKNTIERLIKERLAKIPLKSELKSRLNTTLTFFGSKNENQFNKEFEEFKQILDDEKNSIVQLEEKIDNYLALFKKDDSKKPLYACFMMMKQTLSIEKPKIVRETEVKAEVEAEVLRVSHDKKKLNYFSK